MAQDPDELISAVCRCCGDHCNVRRKYALRRLCNACRRELDYGQIPNVTQSRPSASPNTVARQREKRQ